MRNIIKYQKLFTLQLLHEYYLSQDSSLYKEIQPDELIKIKEKLKNIYDISNDLSISPTNDCKMILDNYHFKFKQDNNGFFVGCMVKTQDNGLYTPFITLDKEICLHFAVYLKNPHILNLSNFRQENANKKDRFLYFFSNRTSNIDKNGTLYLSNPVPYFNSSYDYKSGEIILDIDQDTNYPVLKEAIEDNGPGAFNNSSWIPIFKDINPIPQFASTEDRIVLRPKKFKLDVESAASDKLTIIIYNYEKEIIKTLNFETSIIGKKISECELLLSDLASGYYILEVKDNSGITIQELGLKFFLDDTLYFQNPVALIECYHKPGYLNDYSWIDENQNSKILSPKYTIRIKNRSSLWRYYYKKAFTNFYSDDLKICDGCSKNWEKRILISKQPLGLTQFYRKITVNDIILPNPSNGTYWEKKKIYSEINMGGGLGPPIYEV